MTTMWRRNFKVADGRRPHIETRGRGGGLDYWDTLFGRSRQITPAGILPSPPLRSHYSMKIIILKSQTYLGPQNRPQVRADLANVPGIARLLRPMFDIS